MYHRRLYAFFEMNPQKASTDFLYLTPHSIGAIYDDRSGLERKNEISGFCSELTNFLTLKTKKNKKCKLQARASKKAGKKASKKASKKAGKKASKKM